VTFSNEMGKFKSPKVDKRYLKGVTLEEIQRKFDHHLELNENIEKHKDEYYIEKENNNVVGYSHFSENLPDSTYVEYFFHNYKISSIDVRKKLRFSNKSTGTDVPLYIFSKYFFKDGTLLYVGHDVVGDFAQSIKVGVSKTFNAKGKLQSKINYDKQFTLDLNSILTFAYKHKIGDENGSFDLSRNFNKKEAYWIIEYNWYERNETNTKFLIINDKSKEVCVEFDKAEVDRYRFADYQKKLLNVAAVLKLMYGAEID
jgi:hypothetical protein